MSDIFSFYSHVLHYGNRQDYEIDGDDWHSWEVSGYPGADDSEQGSVELVVKDEWEKVLEKYEVTWRRVE